MIVSKHPAADRYQLSLWFWGGAVCSFVLSTGLMSLTRTFGTKEDFIELLQKMFKRFLTLKLPPGWLKLDFLLNVTVACKNLHSKTSGKLTVKSWCSQMKSTCLLYIKHSELLTTHQDILQDKQRTRNLSIKIWRKFSDFRANKLHK